MPRKTRKSAAMPEPLAMLMADHRRVQKLFKDFEKTDDDARKREIVTTACNELKVHAQLEEELFYPAAREEVEDTEILDEAEVEHQVAKDLIEKLESGGAGDGHYEAGFTVLGEYVNHHIEEEEKQLFPKLKRSGMDFERLAADMMERRHSLREELGLAPEPEPAERAMAGRRIPPRERRRARARPR